MTLRFKIGFSFVFSVNPPATFGSPLRQAPRVTPAVAARAPGLAHFAAVAAGSFTRRLQEAAPSLQLRPEVQVRCGKEAKGRKWEEDR